MSHHSPLVQTGAYSSHEWLNTPKPSVSEKKWAIEGSMQKQLPRGVFKKSFFENKQIICRENLQENTHAEASIPKCDFSKVAL